MMFKKLLLPLITILISSSNTFGTTVQIQTVMGDINVNLYDEATPETVANFLSYVNNGDYKNTFFHRSVYNFIVQGGGYTFNAEANTLSAIPSLPAVTNEPQFSNIKGTIAMAKLGNQPNSATNQWFFNLKDNSGILDGQNEGFTVFGEIMAGGFDIINQIALVPTYDARENVHPAFSALPLRISESDTLSVNESTLVVIYDIVVLNGANDTAAGSNPVLTTRSTDDGGGAILWLLPFLFLQLLISTKANAAR